MGRPSVWDMFWLPRSAGCPEEPFSYVRGLNPDVRPAERWVVFQKPCEGNELEQVRERWRKKRRGRWLTRNRAGASPQSHHYSCQLMPPTSAAASLYSGRSCNKCIPPASLPRLIPLQKLFTRYTHQA